MSATSCLYVTCPLKTLKIPYKIPEDTRTNATIPSTYPIRGTASSSIGPITSQINVLKMDSLGKLALIYITLYQL